MFFWLKKLVGYCLMPVPLLVFLLVVGAFLIWRKRGGRFGRLLLSTGAVLMLLASNKLVSSWLVHPLEQRYAPVPEISRAADLPTNLAACRFVVVLGGGNANTPGAAALTELSTSARARLTEAVRILRWLPEARLLVSGPASQGMPSHATVLEKAAISLGIEPSRIERIEHARDTEDEAIAVKRRAQNTPILLITSAWHMPRAMALFQSAGVNTVACPTDYASHSDGQFHGTDLLWDMESLQRTTVACRERLGYVWIWLRGKAS